jgi:hypothetical protein
MKICRVCALELEDSYLFCPDDGSSLAAGAGSSTQLVELSDDETSHVVLYCPACGAEYPLTFSSCPVHGVQLTTQRIQSLGKRAASDSTDVELNDEAAVLNRPQPITPQTAAPAHDPNLADAKGNDLNSTQAEFVEHSETEAEHSSPTSRADGVQYPPAFLSEAHETEHHGFRIAAIATMIALVIFSLVGLYALVSSLSRRPSPAARTAGQTETAPLPFVVTPQENQDYKEEQPAASAPDEWSQSQAAAQPLERTHKEVSSSSNEHRDRKTPAARSVPTSYSPTSAAPATASHAADPPVDVLSRSNSGEFDSRLVRARASKTSSGYRYDLTFNMQEQRGHSAQWQRVLITTRSASGASHTQAIPFVHRLGATGALTFTISVELTGRSEADWRGRINCTTLGWDNTGAPLQASFVANVTP